MPRHPSFSLSKYLADHPAGKGIMSPVAREHDEVDKIALLSDSEDTYTENSSDDIKFTSNPRHYVIHALRHRKRPSFYMALSIASIVLALWIAFVLGSRSEHRLCYPKQHCRSHKPKSTSIDPSALESINGAKSKSLADMKVVANVFYGRRQYVDILDCYLRRNLVINGGILDEVHFLINAAQEDDVKWIHHLVADPGLQGRYKVYDGNPEATKHGFANLWAQYFTDPDTIYFKIDDDIVFIDDATIPRMVNSLLSHPEAHNIQGNVINNMGTHWFHLRTGAILPYLPDESGPSECNSTWRSSELPCYSGQESQGWRDFRFHYPPPSHHHRWLPLNNTPSNLMRTPFGGILPSPDNKKCRKSRMTWSTQAQLHYSFFDNMENKKLSKYDWGNTEGIWNLWYKHYNINFMVIRGSTVSEAPFWGENPMLHSNDEWSLTVRGPKYLERPVLVDTRALVSHYSFRGTAHKGLRKTDVLDRYRAYANEFVCGPKNQKVSFGKSVERRGNDPIPFTEPDPKDHDRDEFEDIEFEFEFE